MVREVIGPIATPDVIHWAPGLPKTRSGKIMRRILRKIASKCASGHQACIGMSGRAVWTHLPQEYFMYSSWVLTMAICTHDRSSV